MKGDTEMKNDIITKAQEVVDKATENGNSMENLKALFFQAIGKIAEHNEEEAENFIEHADGRLRYTNFITEREYAEAMRYLRDKTKYPIFYADCAVARERLLQRNKNIEQEPYYNFWALLLSMNVIYSDFRDVIESYVDDSNIEDFVYDLAVAMNSNDNRIAWIRQYFDF